MTLLLYKSAYRFMCTVWKMLINIQPFPVFENWIFYMKIKKEQSNTKVLLTWICLPVFALVLNSHTNVNTSELSTPVDFRRMAYVQNLGLYGTVHIHVIKPAKTYTEVCNAVDFHTRVSKTVGLKNRTRVSIHNQFFILIYGICKAKLISSLFFPSSSSNLLFWVEGEECMTCHQRIALQKCWKMDIFENMLDS